jgi:AraC family transcriptional regulator
MEVRVISNRQRSAKVDTLLRGSALRGRSSVELGWNGLIVERRIAPPLERVSEDLDQHYIVLWGGRQPVMAERGSGIGRFASVQKFPGTLSVGTPGTLPAVRSRTPYNVTVCLLDPATVEGVEAELDVHSSGRHQEHLGVDDPALAQLISLAAQEVDEQGACGRLYADSLSHAIISRYARIAYPAANGDFNRVHPLPRRRLRLVLDRIDAQFDKPLDLATLAADSGYSRAQFLRMFRIATGKTPHRYLINVRLDHARRQLQSGAMPITEVALAVGFSSHAHLTKAFRERFGLTPSAYRRNS